MMRSISSSLLLLAALSGSATSILASPSSQLHFPGASAGGSIAAVEQAVENVVKNAFFQHADPAPAAAAASQGLGQAPGDDPLQGMLSGAGLQQPSLRIELPYRSESHASASASSPRMSVEEQIATFNKKNGGKHAVLAHEEFPQMSVRIKRVSEGKGSAGALKRKDDDDDDDDKSDPEAFCDPSVTSWSGYIDTIDGKSLFFYFFESRSSPEKDPVLLWTNGGPGASSAIGLFQELGPCRIEVGSSKTANGPPINGTVVNPYSWNSRSNTIFVDQPAGTGYSYTRYGVEVGDTESGAKDIYRFLRIFFSAFDKFKDNGLILSGESYGGRYLPIFASEIVDMNMAYTDAAFAKGKKPKKDQLIDLKSVMIGNGLTDVSVQIPQYYDYTCTTKGGLDKPIFPIKQCTRMRVYRDMCEKELPKVCKESYNADRCQDLVNTCSAELEAPFMATGRNPYFASKMCEGGLDENLCYPVSADIRAYLNREDVRSLLGAAPVSVIGNYSAISWQVNQAFQWSHDSVLGNDRNLGLLLEHGIPILIYVGEEDWICNHLGNRKMIEEIEWSRKSEFQKEKLYKWRVDGEVAGDAQHGGGLSWATIAGAGHMVPYEKGAQAQAMFHRWIDGEPL